LYFVFYDGLMRLWKTRSDVTREKPEGHVGHSWA